MNEETLFELLRHTHEAERAALLDRECGSDAGLRARVEALLKADAQTLGYRPDPLGTKSFHQPIGEAGQIVAGK